jgi:hypothetical protein
MTRAISHHTATIELVIHLGAGDCADTDYIDVEVNYSCLSGDRDPEILVHGARQISGAVCYDPVEWHDRTIRQRVEDAVEMDEDNVYEQLVAKADRDLATEAA